MSTRNERRQLKKEIGRRVLEHPVMKRMKRNLREGGGMAATEVYRIDGDKPGDHLYFDVYSMRKWAAEHAEQVVTILDWERVERLIKSGAVDRNRIMEHTIHHQMDPIIIGIDAAGSEGPERYPVFPVSPTVTLSLFKVKLSAHRRLRPKKREKRGRMSIFQSAVRAAGATRKRMLSQFSALSQF